MRNAIQCLMGLGLACSCVMALAGPLSLEFAGSGDTNLHPSANGGSLALGAMVAGAQVGHSFADGISLSKQFTLKLVDALGEASYASVTVTQTNDTEGCTVKINGHVLQPHVPVTVDANHPLNTPVSHFIEVQVPRSVDAGNFLSSLEWTVETDVIP